MVEVNTLDDLKLAIGPRTAMILVLSGARSENGPLSINALRATGLTAEESWRAAGLEHRRLRNPGLLPGMDPGERRRRIDQVLPKPGEPWAPPVRAAAMWRLIAGALENDHDVAGVELYDAMTENGTVRSLRLQWRAAIRAGWGAGF